MTDTPTTPDDAWPFVAFADELTKGVQALREEALAFARGQGLTNTPSGDPVTDLQERFDAIGHLVSQLPGVVSGTRVAAAFGDGARPADRGAIVELAHDLLAVYQQFLAWGRATQGCAVPPAFVGAYQALAQFARQPVAGFEEFVAEVARRAAILHNDAVAHRAPSVTFSLALTIHLPDDDVQRYLDAVRTAMSPPRRRWFRR